MGLAAKVGATIAGAGAVTATAAAGWRIADEVLTPVEPVEAEVDPAAAGLAVEEVTYHSPAGEMPAWRFDPPSGGGHTWVVFVHGRDGRRGQVMPWLPTFGDHGLTTLAIAYRNDPDAPASGDGLHHLGYSEWQDVEGAVVHAIGNGARDVVLAGHSMGGTAVCTFLRTSAHADRVRGVILDAPVLHWSPSIRNGLVRDGVPRPLIPVLVPAALATIWGRTGVDWGALDHVGAADRFVTPMLIVHGDADERVPADTSAALARRRPDLVTYLAVAGAGHGQVWETDPDGVSAATAAFLRRLREPGPDRMSGRARVMLRRGWQRGRERLRGR